MSAAMTGGGGSVSGPVVLRDFSAERADAYPSGIPALDSLLGKGLVPGAALLVGGEPGIGKSTLLLQLAGAVADSGHTAVYLSGEESLPQVRTRAERLGVLSDNLLALSTTQIDDIIPTLEGQGGQKPPRLLIVDSVQTLSSSLADGLPGSVSQVRAVTSELLERAKRSGTTLVLVGHVTKDGQLAGPKMLEHMVDTVLSLEGDRKQVFRILRIFKNRFGPTQDSLVFQMVQKGLEVVHDPSTFFLGARDATLSGTAVTIAMDGQRPYAVEVQALVSKTFLAIPRRTALGLDVNRLHLLLAVLEKRLRLNLGQVDIYAKVGGGLKLTDPGIDLALIAAVLSSLYDRPLPEGSVFWGEVDLNGQIRPVTAQDSRMSQAARLGYGPVFCPGHGGAANLQSLQARIFGPAEKG